MPRPTFKARTGVATSISASVVAVDLFTGNPGWHFQECTTTFGTTTARNPPSYSRSRKKESISGAWPCAKTGQYFILDRRTGQPIFAVTEQPVPASA